MAGEDAAASGVGALANGKIGGLPAPIVLGVGAGALWLINSRRKSATVAASTAAATNGSAQAFQGSGLPGNPAGWAAMNPNASSSTPTPTNNGITDNSGWSMQAESWLLAQNYPPALVDSAVRNYVFGVPLQTNEQAVVNVALKQFGPLPQPPVAGATPVNQVPLAPVPVAAAPTPPPPTPVYTAGQTVAPGESIVAMTLNAAQSGWLYLTSKGGVYTSGGAQTSGLGSFLGYTASLPANARQAQLDQHGNFTRGSIVNSGGGYRIVNNNGEAYNF